MTTPPPAPPSLNAAYANARRSIGRAIKTTEGQVGSVKKNYADMADVDAAVKDALDANHLTLVQVPVETERQGVLIHNSLLYTPEEGREFEEERDLGAMFIPSAQSSAQGYGSAITYARRYSMMTVLGVIADDDDGAAASTPPPAARQQAQPQAASRPVAKLSDQQREKLRVALIAGGKEEEEAYRLALDVTPQQYPKWMDEAKARERAAKTGGKK